MYKFLVAFILITLSSCFETIKNKEELIGTDFPTFTIQIINKDSIIATRKIGINMPIIVFYFSPICSICRNEISELLNNYAKIQTAITLIITPFSKDKVVQFYKEVLNNKYENVIIASDTSNFLGKNFSIRSFPCVFIYNRNHKLINIYSEPLNLSDIYKYLKNDIY